MAREKIEEAVEKIVNDIIAGTGLEVVDVEYIKEREWYLRIFLDKEKGIELDDCQWVSERVEAKLDELDIIKERYYLEVSSPGLDRPLKKNRDYVRHKGDKVEIKTYEPVDGQKVLIGTLVDLIDDIITINIGGAEVHLPKEKVAQVRLHIDF
ncbi:MAG TPA: ribosome maturation factor RimP [Methylomusa anaerophila]|uniref:Ribosome maturation factor RimP n=1 Tax=Methylomusa anaerophila TaxID=1930071 RepID=A0A348APZ3_9FIRM|nr:ribosome maturation factor RimP [Methylomusa anaerophila]BBB93141.1 ribosome maturation factor RimP [Methylomusa anaerophila]HML87026.1 ribosome maturation factor RimP [Methylomusa anaerophila]